MPVAHNEEYRKLISGYMIRHKVRPGITGWAQVNGLRGETSTVEKMQRRVSTISSISRTGRSGWISKSSRAPPGRCSWTTTLTSHKGY